MLSCSQIYLYKVFIALTRLFRNDYGVRNNCQFSEGPRGPKLSWDYTNEMSKCNTGKYFIFARITAIFCSSKYIEQNQIYGIVHSVYNDHTLLQSPLYLLRTSESAKQRKNQNYGREGWASVTFAHLIRIIPTQLQAPWALAELAIILHEIRCMFHW